MVLKMLVASWGGFLLIQEFDVAKKVNYDDEPFLMRKYSWDEWLDGDWWMLTKGEDFFNEINSFRRQVCQAANRRNMKAATRARGDSVLYIRAIPKN